MSPTASKPLTLCNLHGCLELHSQLFSVICCSLQGQRCTVSSVCSPASWHLSNNKASRLSGLAGISVFLWTREGLLPILNSSWLQITETPVWEERAATKLHRIKAKWPFQWAEIRCLNWQEQHLFLPQSICWTLFTPATCATCLPFAIMTKLAKTVICWY